MIRKIRDARQRTSVARPTMPLLRWVPELSPHLSEPRWLGPFVEMLERGRKWVCDRRDGIENDDRVKACASVPPGHAKSTTVHHWVALLLAEDPTLRIGYGTYDADFAAVNVAACRKLVEEAQVAIGEIDRADTFTTVAGGCVVGFGLLAPPTGRRFDVIVIDDPYRSRQEAESRAIREKVVRGVRSDLMSRQPAGGSLFVIIHTRWHPDDLIGTLTKRKGKGAWESVNLPALNRDGEPLAPHLWSKDMLAEVRAESEYDWWSLYMGEPRAPGGTLFLDAPAIIETAEPGAHVYACGFDIARGEHEKDDEHGLCVMRKSTSEKTRTPVVQKLEVIAERGPMTDVETRDEAGRAIRKPGFVRHLIGVAQRYPGIRFVIYMTQRETATLRLIEHVCGIKIHMRDARKAGTKWDRAGSGYSQAWNQKRVQLVSGPWVAADVREHVLFTGKDGEPDARVDSGCAAYDELVERVPASGGKARSTGEGSEVDRLHV